MINMKPLTMLLLAVTMVKADSIELLAAIDGGGEQLLDLNNNGLVVGQSCFDGCGTSLWFTAGRFTAGQTVVRPQPDYLLLPAAADTVPVDLNDSNQVLVWSFPYAWGAPGELFLPTYAIFALTAPRGAKECSWNEHGFAGKVGKWCLNNDGAIEPVQIEDGYSAVSNFGLWNGDGLHTTNELGQSIRPCEADCWDAANNGKIAGYLDSPDSLNANTSSMADPAPVPEPSAWLLLATGFGLVALARKTKCGR